jgi:hypothetical protein
LISVVVRAAQAGDLVGVTLACHAQLDLRGALERAGGLAGRARRAHAAHGRQEEDQAAGQADEVGGNVHSPRQSTVVPRS